MRIIAAGKIAIGYSIGSLSQVGLGILIVILAARSLDLREFGLLSFFMAIASIQQPIASFGTQQIVYGRVALRRNRLPRLTGQACQVSAIASAVLYSVTGITLLLVYDSLTAIIYLAVGLRVFGSVALPLVSSAQARHELQEYIPIRLLTSSVAILLVVLAYIFKWNVVCFAIIWGGEALVFAVVLAATSHNRLYFLRLRSKKITVGLLRASYPIAIQSIMIAMYYRFDHLYIQLRFGSEEMAIYSSAARLAEIGNILATVGIMTIGPEFISKLYSNDRIKSSILRGVCITTLATAFISLLLFLLGEGLLTFVYGEEYSSGYAILSVYFLSTAFVAIGALSSRALSAKNDTKIQAISGIVGMFTITIFSVLLCEILGPIGAAWATVLAYVASSIVLIKRILYLGVN